MRRNGAVTSSEQVFLPIEQLQPLRVKRLYDELAFALSRTDGTVLRGWGGRAAGRLFHLGARRVGGLAQLVSGLAHFGGKEVGGFYRALRGSRFGAHAGQRTAAAIDGAIAVGNEGGRFLTGISRALLRDPKGMAPKVLGAFLGFNTGSGGLDGNGGIPDLDLLAGIGYHRSPLTHSIIAGIVAEGMLLAIGDLAAEIHSRLPHEHDGLWDGLARVGRPFAESASISLSAGIAWHLLVDAGIQPAPYHDLPFSMPIEAHQAVFAANGAAEGVDAARRAGRKARGPKLLEPNEKPQRSTGERVVDGVAKAAQRAGAGVWKKTGAMAQSIADRVRWNPKQ
jgi:hypothetical protein